jgi:hypothetical protein
MILILLQFLWLGKLILVPAVGHARRGRVPPPNEQLAVNIRRRFDVLCLWHDHKLSRLNGADNLFMLAPCPFCYRNLHAVNF